MVVLAVVAPVWSKSIISEADATGIPGWKAEMTAAVKNGSDLDGNVCLPAILADDHDVDAAEEDGDSSTAMSSLDRTRLLLLVLMVPFFTFFFNQWQCYVLRASKQVQAFASDVAALVLPPLSAPLAMNSHASESSSTPSRYVPSTR